MIDYFMDENELTKQLFNLDKILAFQLKHDVQIIRGEDYQYMCYINKSVYATGLTPLFALSYGIQRFNQCSENKTDIETSNLEKTNNDVIFSLIEKLIEKYEDKIKSVEDLKNKGRSTWGSDSPTKEDRDRFDVRIYERKTFISDLKLLLTNVNTNNKKYGSRN